MNSISQKILNKSKIKNKKIRNIKGLKTKKKISGLMSKPMNRVT
jgi:hypothetical protein